MGLGNYLELVRQAQQKRVQITREQEKEIRSLYREIPEPGKGAAQV